MLQGFFVQPTYQAETHAVTLEPSSPEIETWNNRTMLRLPSGAIFICRADGKISYAIDDTVTTWDWPTDTYEVTEVKNAACITALAEKSDGSLILGDEKGQLHVSGKIIDTRVQQSITEILYFHDAWALIKYEKILEKERGETGLKKLNFLTGEVEEVDSQTEILVLGDSSLAILDKSTVRWEQFDQTQRRFIELPSRAKKENISNILLASKTKVLFLHQDNKELLTMYDMEDDIEAQTEQTWKNKDRWKNYDSGFLYACLDDQAIAVSNMRSVTFYYRDDLAKEPMRIAKAELRNATAMITLSNGSIICGTYNSGISSIFVVDIEGKIAFNHTFSNENSQIESLTELPNGSIAIKFYDSIKILQPQFKDKSIHSDNESKHSTYLASLEAAFKQANFYKARRFYEKAKKLPSNSNAHSLISLLHLKKSLNKKLYRQILLNTLYDQNNKEVKDLHLEQEVSTWKAKTCKKRLFIGEGTFTFTEAFIKKHEKTHPLLASSIVATELTVPAEKKEDVMQRVSRLRELGVTVLFGIDGQFLHNHFREKRIKRIHWNCPYTGKGGGGQDKFKAAIPQFFLSCTHLQMEGDRIHIALMHEKESQTREKNWKSRQKENSIVLGATSAGYRLIRKRLFGPKRYPGYQHAKTDGNDHTAGDGEQREFVFEKAHQPSAKAESEFLACARSLENEFSKNVNLLKDEYAQYVSNIKNSFVERKIKRRDYFKKINFSEKTNPAEGDFSAKVKELEEQLYLNLQQAEKNFEDKVRISNFNFLTIERRNSQDIQAVCWAYVQKLENSSLDYMRVIGRKYLYYAKYLEINFVSIYANLSDYSQEKVSKSKRYFIDLCDNPKVSSPIDENDKTSTGFIGGLESLNKTLSDREGELRAKTLKIIKDLKILSLAYINALMDPNKKEFAIKIFQGIDKKSGQSGSSNGINFDLQNCYYECSSDEDSSDCYDSD
ncbi:Rossmann-like fold-containing protein [Neochlamydia sp. AcF95]|uniref:class I SAM-dependent methyltransferase n=1 Tax=Neochlamydia sp. AcF95 TaxID=2795734 RepID=UPI001BC9D443|nr:Rossmann-like fold-containing protein [Neochlamydia sp. AcF95]